MSVPEPTVRGLAPAWLAWCVFIAYGSLLPFELRSAPPEGALSAFMHMPWLQIGLGGRLDWLANLLLYVPAGFFGTLVLLRPARSGDCNRFRAHSLLAAATVLLLSAALALAIEFAQIYVAPRTVSLNDVAAELVGAAIGCAAALMFGAFLARVLAQTRTGGPAMRGAWLRLYFLVYLALSFFPFDVSTAGAVFEQKLVSGHAGWWWAPYQQARPATALLKLLLEAALTVPFGLALATSPRRLSWLRAGLWGLALGVAIEITQLFLLSATSQGASAVSRAIGMTAGAALAPHLPALAPRLKTSWLRAVAGVLTLPWFVAVVYLAGWGRSEIALGTWHERAQEVRFLPFYYHYYAGEAQALTSVLQGFASFALVGIGIALCWTRGRAVYAALAAALVSIGIEASKLLLVGQHPDPTNVLVAAASAAAAWALVRSLRDGSRPVGTTPPPMTTRHGGATQAPQETTTAAGSGTAWALVTAAVVLAAAQLAPGHPLGMFVAVAAYAVCVWRHPPAALLLIPVAIALTDTASFTGHQWLELLDLIILATLGIALLRPMLHRPTADAPAIPLWLGVICGLLLVPGVVTGLQGADWPDANALLSPLSPWNGLLLAKGLGAAFVLLWFAHRLRLDADTGARCFGRGMVLALAGVVFLTVRERLAFVGPLDFSSDYRAPGPFTAIALGGAYIECFLAAAVPFAVVGAFRERLRVVRWGCGLLVLAAAYATMVTYSRAGQVVFLAVVGAAVLLLAMQRVPVGSAGSHRMRLLGGAGLTLAVAAIAGSILMSPYATTRFKQLDGDTQVRLDHWSQGLGYGRDDTSAMFVGNGLGSFGRESYVQVPPAGRPGVFLLHEEAGDSGRTRAPWQLVLSGPARQRSAWRAVDRGRTPAHHPRQWPAGADLRKGPGAEPHLWSGEPAHSSGWPLASRRGARHATGQPLRRVAGTADPIHAVPGRRWRHGRDRRHLTA